MKNFWKFLSIISIISLTASPSLASAQIVAENNYIQAEIPQEVIVKYKHKEEIAVVEVPEETEIEEVIAAIEENTAVEYAEPNFVRQLSTLDIDDTYANLLWGHDNTGQSVNGTSGTADADMDIAEAWEFATGTEDILVGVIDTGVLYTHPDLSSSMWESSVCLDENGTTTTCIHGYDFENNDSDPLPDHFHGTHISGTIAAGIDNNLGIAGVSPRAKVVALRFALDVASEVRAIDFAIQNGIKIINASYGGPEFSQAEYDAIERFRAAGGIFIAAAGNSSQDNDSAGHNYPSDHPLDNIIAVAATDQNDNLASFSSWGRTSVDVAAPGSNILSTYLNNQYAYANGTSMSTAYVSGVVALVWSVYPTLSSSEVIERILETGDPLASLSGKTVTGKRVNAYNALDNVAPQVLGLTDDSATTTAKTWSWSSDESTASFRFEISSTSTPNLSGIYGNVTTVTATSTATSTVYLHVQAKDAGGNESSVATVSAPLIPEPPAEPEPTPEPDPEPEPQPAPPAQSSGGGGGGGGGGGATTVTPPLAKAGDINSDSKVDLLDFNSLMINWSGRANPFLDFNSLMINWTN